VASQHQLRAAMEELLGQVAQDAPSGLLRLKKKDSVVLFLAGGWDLTYPTELKGIRATWVVPPEDFAPLAGAAGANLKFNMRRFATVIRGSDKKVVRGADIEERSCGPRVKQCSNPWSLVERTVPCNATYRCPDQNV
jgi:hypothetical protein